MPSQLCDASGPLVAGCCCVQLVCLTSLGRLHLAAAGLLARVAPSTATCHRNLRLLHQLDHFTVLRECRQAEGPMSVMAE